MVVCSCSVAMVHTSITICMVLVNSSGIWYVYQLFIVLLCNNLRQDMLIMSHYLSKQPVWYRVRAGDAMWLGRYVEGFLV